MQSIWLGTDQFGRDILTRILFGARTALLVGFSAATVGAVGGLVLGVASAYFGGMFDLDATARHGRVHGIPTDHLGDGCCGNVGPWNAKRDYRDHHPVHSAVCPCGALERVGDP